MRGRSRDIAGHVETSAWSNGLEDDPWPHLIEVLERIARALERIGGGVEE